MNRQWKGSVEGPLCGYTRTTQRQKFVDPRAKRYDAWKKMVAWEARHHGFPVELDVCLAYEFRVIVRWRFKARIDLDNIIKGLLDGIWPQDRGILSIHAEAGEHTGEEALWFTLTERWVRKSTTGGAGGKASARQGGASSPTSADPYAKAFRRRRP